MPHRSRWLRGALGALLGAHLGFLAWGFVDEDASQRFDRTRGRLTSVRLLLEAEGPTEIAAVLRTRGTPGNYVWHALVLGPTGGSLVAVQLVQLVLAGLSLVAVHRIALALGASRDAALLAAVLYAAIPIDFMVPHFLASEAFFNPLLVLGVAALARYATIEARLGTLAAAGAAFGLAALTRTEGLPWLLLMFGFAVVLSRRLVGARAPLHLATLACLTFGGVALHMMLAPSEPIRIERPSPVLEWELAYRAHRVLSSAGAESAGVETAPIAAFTRALLEHPLAFLREWVLQAAKLLVLPDNLDVFRYLGFYEFTGRRADRVHELGLLGALRSTYDEMPGLTLWLLGSVAVWLGVWMLVFRGAAGALRSSAGVQRLLVWLLLSLPVVWTLLRVLTQGESRKRSPVDFALAIFAALGVWRARGGVSPPATGSDRAAC